MRPKRRCVAVFRNLLLEETGQDTIEYALLLAFVVLAACCVVMMSGESVTGIWTQSGDVLNQAQSAAGSGS